MNSYLRVLAHVMHTQRIMTGIIFGGLYLTVHSVMKSTKCRHLGAKPWSEICLVNVAHNAHAQNNDWYQKMRTKKGEPKLSLYVSYAIPAFKLVMIPQNLGAYIFSTPYAEIANSSVGFCGA
mgnify:CR=1 FL=1